MCLWEVKGFGSTFVDAVDLIEMKRVRKVLLCSPVNEKLLVSYGLCVGRQTAGVMWERGHSQKGCLSGDIFCRGRQG